MAKSNDDLDKSIRSLGVLVERVLDQNQLMYEILGDVQQKVSSLPTMQNDITELKQDVKTIKIAVTDTSQQVHLQEGMINKLHRKVV